MKLFTIDRIHSLKSGEVLNLFHDYGFQVDAPDFIGANEMVKSFFPEGISKHGNKYVFNSVSNDTTSFTCELVFELYRQCKYPESMSRFQAVFAVEEKNIDRLAKKLDASNYNVHEVEAERMERYDMNLVKGDTYAICMYFAELYWSGTASDDPLWEYLLMPPVNVK